MSVTILQKPVEEIDSIDQTFDLVYMDPNLIRSDCSGILPCKRKMDASSRKDSQINGNLSMIIQIGMQM